MKDTWTYKQITRETERMIVVSLNASKLMERPEDKMSWFFQAQGAFRLWQTIVEGNYRDKDKTRLENLINKAWASHINEARQTLSSDADGGIPI